MDDASTLCTRCGMCCTGHVFHRARTTESEIPLLDELKLAHHYDAELGKSWFNLPCHHWDQQCTTYAHKPVTCGKYECQLLTRVKAGAVGLDEALKLTSDIKRLGSHLRQELMPDIAERHFDRQRLVAWIKDKPSAGQASDPKLFVDAVAYERAVSKHLMKAPAAHSKNTQNN